MRALQIAGVDRRRQYVSESPEGRYRRTAGRRVRSVGLSLSRRATSRRGDAAKRIVVQLVIIIHLNF